MEEKRYQVGFVKLDKGYGEYDKLIIKDNDAFCEYSHVNYHYVTIHENNQHVRKLCMTVTGSNSIGPKIRNTKFFPVDKSIIDNFLMLGTAEAENYKLGIELIKANVNYYEYLDELNQRKIAKMKEN